MGLLGCRSRKELVSGGDLFACLNPRVHARHELVSATVCSTCPSREEPPVAAIKERTGEAPSVERRNPPMTAWSVGMTTATRARPTLEKSLASLAAAGWTAPRLFAEPSSPVPARFDRLAVAWRDRTLGAFPNWYLGLSELFLRDPLADAYLMCQDDALFAEGARDYLEQHLWPAASVGVVSIYTPGHWSRGQQRGFHIEAHGWASWGALAYIFPNPSLRALLAHPLFIDHRHHGTADGLRNIDSVVGAWCESVGLPYFVHVPSLVQHIGETSTIWSRASATGPRRAADFVPTIGGWRQSLSDAPADH